MVVTTVDLLPYADDSLSCYSFTGLNAVLARQTNFQHDEDQAIKRARLYFAVRLVPDVEALRSAIDRDALIKQAAVPGIPLEDPEEDSEDSQPEAAPLPKGRDRLVGVGVRVLADLLQDLATKAQYPCRVPNPGKELMYGAHCQRDVFDCPRLFGISYAADDGRPLFAEWTPDHFKTLKQKKPRTKLASHATGAPGYALFPMPQRAADAEGPVVWHTDAPDQRAPLQPEHWPDIVVAGRHSCFMYGSAEHHCPTLVRDDREAPLPSGSLLWRVWERAVASSQRCRWGREPPLWGGRERAELIQGAPVSRAAAGLRQDELDR